MRTWVSLLCPALPTSAPTAPPSPSPSPGLRPGLRGHVPAKDLITTLLEALPPGRLFASNPVLTERALPRSGQERASRVREDAIVHAGAVGWLSVHSAGRFGQFLPSPALWLHRKGKRFQPEGGRTAQRAGLRGWEGPERRGAERGQGP